MTSGQRRASEARGSASRAGIFLLFGVEMWERFSFYGMKAFLVLFVADSARGGLGWSEASASRLMGVYGFMRLRAAGAGRLRRRSVPGHAPRAW